MRNNLDLFFLSEFILDLYPEASDNKENEPEWVQNERSHFKELRDINKDNVMDREELANWILPNDFDRSLSEAQHLIYEADENKVIVN